MSLIGALAVAVTLAAGDVPGNRAQSPVYPSTRVAAVGDVTPNRGQGPDYPARRAAGAAYAFARGLAAAGPRPAASRAEARAHARVAERFRGAGLRVAVQRFDVPGLGRSRNVYGMQPGAEDCLKVVMAHADSDPPAPGANDNASGVGALVSLADGLEPGRCDVWLVATGAEERGFLELPDHQGALWLARRLQRRAGDVRFALSLDEVGRGTSFWLRSPAASPRLGVERSLLRVARAEGVPVRWVRDETGGNSDHREIELAGMPGMKLGVPDDPCRHTVCDTPDRLERGAFRRVLRVVAPLLD